MALQDDTIMQVYCGLFHFASKTLDSQTFDASRRGNWPTSSTPHQVIQEFALRIYDMMGISRPAGFRARSLRRLKKKFHIDKYHISVAERNSMNLDELNFRAFYQFYTIGLFLKGMGSLRNDSIFKPFLGTTVPITTPYI